MSLSTRLDRLENLRPANPAPWLVAVDDTGHIKDANGPQSETWIGRHVRELPPGVKVLSVELWESL